jgi:hypothetical protein
VLSLGNPWLDFLDEKEAAPLAKDLNADLQEYCEEYSEHFYGFGVLPTSSPAECVMELERISKLDKLRGAIVTILLSRLVLMVAEKDWMTKTGSQYLLPQKDWD